MARGKPESFLLRVLRRYREEGFSQVAGSLAFTTLLSLVPLVAVALAILSVMPGFPDMLDRLELAAYGVLPVRSADLIVTRVIEFSQKATKVTVAGLLFLAPTAFFMLQTMERAFNHVWRVAERRRWWRRLGLFALLLLLWPFAVAYVVAAVSYAVALSEGVVAQWPWLRALLSKATGSAVVVLVLSTLYVVLPNARVRWRHAVFAGGIAAAGFLAMQKGFEFYLVTFPSMTFIYGAFATVPIFLLWMYLSWALVLLGALIAATLGEDERWGAMPPQFPS